METGRSWEWSQQTGWTRNPQDLSLKKSASPPLTLTLFLGPSFLPFPFRAGGSWSPARQHPQDPAAAAKMKDKSRLLGGQGGAVFLLQCLNEPLSPQHARGVA